MNEDRNPYYWCMGSIIIALLVVFVFSIIGMINNQAAYEICMAESVGCDVWVCEAEKSIMGTDRIYAAEMQRNCLLKPQSKQILDEVEE